MPKYLVEVPHRGEKAVCLKVVHLLLEVGSHYLSHCDWGIMDGELKSWITVEVDSPKEAIRILPPLFRAKAKVVQLEKFSLNLGT